jgi:predicted PurR-regulated permease PerM
LTAPDPHPRRDWSAERVRVTALSVGLATVALVGTMVARNVFVVAHRPISWVVAAAVVAALFDPVIDVLARRIKRGPAIIATLLAIGLFAGSVGFGVFTDLHRQLDELEVSLPNAATRLERDESLGKFARDVRLTDQVREIITRIDGQVSTTNTLQQAAGTAPAYLVSLVLVVFFWLWGRRIFDGGIAQLAGAERRARVERRVLVALRRAQRYGLAVLGQAVVVGLLGAGMAWWAGLPTPAVLGFVLAMASLIPLIGVLFGAVPLLLLSAAFEPASTTIGLGVALAGIEVATVVVGRRLVEPHSLRVGPALIVVVGMVGADVYGLGGAAYGVLLATFGVALLDAWTADDDAAPAAAPDTPPRDDATVQPA